MSTETCPHCGGTYKRLSIHLLHCKDNPENIEVSGTSYSTPDDYTFSVSEPVGDYVDTVPIPDHECPYLVIIAGNACSTCRGVSCMASKDKKISDTLYCKTEWPDCLLYEEAVENGVRPICPYYGLPPPDKPHCCSGQYCYAKNSAVKVIKACYHWNVCSTYLMAKYEGVPFHRSKL